MTEQELFLLYAIIYFTFAVSTIALIISNHINKSKKKRRALGYLLCSLLLFVLFHCSHKTYYKYNDWFVLNSNIYRVREVYGDFDLFTIENNPKGYVGYYVYKDTGPLMPSYLPQYYTIYYDEQGIVYMIDILGPPGG